jgi:rhomboid family GlyGly-CTERM serine protease
MPAALSAVATVLMLGGETWQQALAYQRQAIAAGQWWRLLSGNFVHLSWWHLFFNVLSLGLLALLCPERLPMAEWLRRIVALGAGMSLGLYWLAPGVSSYVGLSGMIYGMFALGFGRQALQRDEIGIACLAFILVRIGWELWAGASAAEVRLIGPVVPLSHLYGVASAAIYALAAMAWVRLWRHRRREGIE